MSTTVAELDLFMPLLIYGNLPATVAAVIADYVNQSRVQEMIKHSQTKGPVGKCTDYVNQSQIQEMIAKSQQSSVPPSSQTSPPDASSLPAPIMVFPEDSTSNRRSQPSPLLAGRIASGVGEGVGGETNGVGMRDFSGRFRSGTFSGSFCITQPAGSPAQPTTPHYANIPGPPPTLDVQHADYVNQSRIQEMINQSQPGNKQCTDYVNQSLIQEMIAQSQQSGCLPSSPPDASSLPAPIMVFTEDSTSNRGNQPPPVQGGMTASSEGEGSVISQGRERRGTVPASDINNEALHERQHRLLFNHPANRTKVRPQPKPMRDQPPSHHRPPPSDSVLSEGGYEDMKMTETPYDPNLTCIICQKRFRVGEIQRFRTHTKNCVGTMV